MAALQTQGSNVQFIVQILVKPQQPWDIRLVKVHCGIRLHMHSAMIIALVGFTRIKEILDQDNKYVNPQNLITFIDNHDRDRFLCVADDSYEKLRMALAFIFTVRGIPDVYYAVSCRAA